MTHPLKDLPKAKKGRNAALALGLAAFVVLVFVITMVRLAGNVQQHF